VKHAEVSPKLPWPLVEVTWLAAQTDNPRIIALDATVDLPAPRFDGDYRVTSGSEGWLREHIPGSRHADLVNALAIKHPVCSFTCPPAEKLARSFEELGISDTSIVVAYDRADGLWAARLWWMLHSLGVNALVLDGGWRAWSEAGLPVAQGKAATFEPGVLHPHVHEKAWANQEDVLAVVEGRTKATLVCGLSEAVFSGESATRYARRGHIPGSMNLPARSLLDKKTGRYRSMDELTRLVQPLLTHSQQPLIFYCGGGISAAVDAVVLAMLGREDISIYDGSWQEWSADMRLPIELGCATASRAGLQEKDVTTRDCRSNS
jgi:thiosulfate/3-mercaptopyruvate sulfurtransferase